MPVAAPRRVGVAGLLGLLAGALVLMVAPGNPGALRLAGIGLLWWYSAAVAPCAAVLLGLPRWAAGVLATLVALVTLELAQAAGVARGGGLTLLYASALGFVALVALVAVTLVVSPWGAWRAVASRSALTFSELSPWVTEGRTLARSTTLDFNEAHQVTALSPVVYRMLEPGRFREGQLHAGESLSLRAGDRLVLDAGARLRFEAGKRIPGSPASPCRPRSFPGRAAARSARWALSCSSSSSPPRRSRCATSSSGPCASPTGQKPAPRARESSSSSRSCGCSWSPPVSPASGEARPRARC